MENEIQSPFQGIRNKITRIEAVELAILGFLFWCLISILSLQDPDAASGFVSLVITFVVVEGALFLIWGIYNAYIRVARAGGRFVDIGLWVIAALITGSITFWTWLILDVNRIIMSKLFYRGDAPVEYAWSVRSKQIRKLWEEAHKAN